MSEIRENSREIITKCLVEDGFMFEMQALYIQKVCEAASESNHPIFQDNIKLPKTKAQEIAAEMVIQYLENKNMKRTVSSILSESHQQFVRKHDNDWLQQETKCEKPDMLLHELVDNWKTLDTEISLKPGPEESSALNRMLGIEPAQQDNVKSRSISLTNTTDDQTIGNDTIQTGQGSRRPWKIPPKKPIRGRKNQQLVGPPEHMVGNGHRTVTVLSGTLTTGTPTGDSWSQSSEVAPVVQRVVRKVKRSKNQPQKVDKEIEVTLSEDTTSTTSTTNDSTNDKTKSSQQSEKHSYTTTYNTVNPTPSHISRGVPTTTYTYSYETVTVPKPDSTTSTKTGETIQSTDSFPRQFDAPPPARRSSTSSRKSSSSRQSEYSVSSQQKPKSRHSSRASTRDTYDNEPVSRQSTQSRHSRTSSRHSTRDSDATPRQANTVSSRKSSTKSDTLDSTQTSQRKKAPPPLPQPGSTNNNSSSSQDTYHKMMKESPLGDILAMQDANGGVLPQSQPTQSSGSTGNVSVHVMSQSGSKKSQPLETSSSDVPDLDSSTLGDVKSDDDRFKSDSVNSEKMASDKELWSSKKHN